MTCCGKKKCNEASALEKAAAEACCGKESCPEGGCGNCPMALLGDILADIFEIEGDVKFTINAEDENWPIGSMTIESEVFDEIQEDLDQDDAEGIELKFNESYTVADFLDWLTDSEKDYLKRYIS